MSTEEFEALGLRVRNGEASFDEAVSYFKELGADDWSARFQASLSLGLSDGDVADLDDEDKEPLL